MTRYPVVRASNGMIATPHYLASAAGLDILRRGGNALDAAIAANAVLTVVYPHMTSIGGDLFMLYYDAGSRELVGLNGSGRAPRAATCERLRDMGMEKMPDRGGLTITVPGTVKAWEDALNRYGTMSLGDLLQPAIGYAEDGYPVTPNLRDAIELSRSFVSMFPETESLLFPNGRTPAPGSVFRNPKLADMLRKIGMEGAEAFYKGEIAGSIVQIIAENGGLMSAEDLAAHQSDWVDPLCTDYRGYQIYEFPPNSQGLTVLEGLNILEAYDLRSLGHLSADASHLMVEAKKLAFADRDRYICDPSSRHIPTDMLTSKEYAARRRELIEPNRTSTAYPAGSIEGDTIYLCTADRNGNAVSLIQSIYKSFGSGVTAAGTGIMLNNRGSYFSLDPDHVNCIAPSKRTMHTLSPGMAMKNGKPYLIFGTMGGDGQPQTHLQLLTGVFDFGLSPQEAIEAPRWLSGRLTPGRGDDMLFVESRFPEETLRGLEARGHIIRPVGDWAQVMGHAQAILVDQAGGTLEGAADPRSDGLALGW